MMNRMTRLIGICFVLAAWCTFAAFAASSPAPPPDILEAIRLSEYEFSMHDGSYSAPNRAHGFRTHITAEGLVLTDRVRGAAEWRVVIKAHRFGREGELRPIEAGTVTANGARLEVAHPGLVEWYVSSPEGLEQGLDVEAPPAGDRARPVVLELELQGTLRPRMEGDAILFDRPDGGGELRYDSLHVYDASGRALQADLALDGSVVRVRFQDEAAIYPLTIDPLLADPTDTLTGSGGFGYSVADGDFDGDGYFDLVVGAPYFDGGSYDLGKVFVYFGSSTGFVTPADWTAEGDSSGMNLGFSVANAGDVDGNTYDDLLVGAPHISATPAAPGEAFIWFGGSGGLGSNGTPGNADWTASAGDNGDEFGYAVAGGADVNDDTYADIIVGAPGYEDPSGHTDEGWVFAYYGVYEDGPSTTADWSAQSKTESWHPKNSRLGSSVAFGNFNGDDYDDVIVGAPFFKQDEDDQGNAFVWLGGDDGLNSNNSGNDGHPPNSDWRAKSDQEGAQLGTSVLAADVDGDGYDEAVAGAPFHGSGGSVFLWPGSSSFNTSDDGTPGNADWQASSSQADAELGTSIAAVDILKEGAESIVAGAHQYDGKGALFAWHACDGSGLDGSSTTTNGADWSYVHDTSGAEFGRSATRITDIEDDGCEDLAGGAPGANEALTFNSNGNLPTVEVTEPNGGEVLICGIQTTIEWSATAECSASVPTVDIELSRSGPSGPFELLYNDISNDGSQTWVPFGPPTTTNCYVRVTAPGQCGTNGLDMSDSAFKIRNDTSCGPCPLPYCQDEGILCSFDCSCGGGGTCCNFSCEPDESCTGPDPIPDGVCN